MLIDKYDRIANYLRLGVTDRCNLRCRYCMPAEGIDFADRADIMSYEEIVRICRIMAGLGVNKVRLTGGEPFVRKEIDVLLRSLAEIFESVHITTNATLLHKHVDLLNEIKVAGLNISLDSLHRERFFMITRRDDYDIVQDNIRLLLDQGLPIKINMVVMKGINDGEILDFVRYGMEHDVSVRFIEAMPFNAYDGNRKVFMPATEIVQVIKEHYPQLVKMEAGAASSADHYSIGSYQLGVIPAYTRSLCGSCNRIRLTPKGELMTCLYATAGTAMLPLLRDINMTDTELQKVIIDATARKKKTGHVEEQLQKGQGYRSMTTIGG